MQNVARRMVSTNPRRSDSERPPTSVPLQNGYLAGESPGSSYGATTSGRGFGSGGNLGSSGLNVPQDSSLLPSASAGMPHTSGAGVGMPGAAGNHFMQQSGMPMHSAPGLSSSRMLQGQVGDSGMGMGMLGSNQVKTDPGPSGAIGMGGMGSYPMNSGHPNFIRSQNPPGPGPVMSNGAPVLLRSSRDWAPGQTSSVMNVRSCITVLLTGIIGDCSPATPCPTSGIDLVLFLLALRPAAGIILISAFIRALCEENCCAAAISCKMEGYLTLACCSYLMRMGSLVQAGSGPGYQQQSSRITINGACTHTSFMLLIELCGSRCFNILSLW